MTRKEKKEEALRLKKEIDDKKPKPEFNAMTKEHMAANNHRRDLLTKARNRKGTKIFKEVNKNHWDFEKW